MIIRFPIKSLEHLSDEEIVKHINNIVSGAPFYKRPDELVWELHGNDYWLRKALDYEEWLLTSRYARKDELSATKILIEWFLGINPLEVCSTCVGFSFTTKGAYRGNFVEDYYKHIVERINQIVNNGDLFEQKDNKWLFGSDWTLVRLDVDNWILKTNCLITDLDMITFKKAFLWLLRIDEVNQ